MTSAGTTNTLRVGLVGCGSIAATHLRALRGLEGVEVCGVADLDERRARWAAKQAGDVAAYTNAEQLFAQELPDAVHVLTPPPSHASVAISALEAGAHVLVEKPMALSSREAHLMLDVAARNQRTLGTCHNMLYTPAMRRALKLVRHHAIGDVVHVACFWGIVGDKGPYLGDAGCHWAWRLPGGWFTNFLPHLISIQQAFLGLDVTIADVLLARDLPGSGTVTELTAVTAAPTGWGTMTISTARQPAMRSVDIYGTKGVIRVDLAREICVLQPARQMPGVVNKVVFSVEHATQLLAGTAVSVAAVAAGKRRSNPGMDPLIADFHHSVRVGAKPPISGQHGVRMVEAMESIWNGAGSKLTSRPESVPDRMPPQTAAERGLLAAGGLTGRVLVTGATGFLGAHVARAAYRCGSAVAVLVRDRSRLPFDIEAFADVIEGDLSDRASVDRAVTDADVVFHCAAITSNSAHWSEHDQDTVNGTKSLCQAAAADGVSRLVHVSSVAVYGMSPSLEGAPVGEDTRLCDDDDRWANYMRAKVAAERAVAACVHELGLRATIVRPGILYGPGRPVRGGIVQLGDRWVGIGRGRNLLPFTFVDNAVDALLLAASAEGAIGEAFNVVDEPQLSVSQLLSQENTGERYRLIAFPVRLADALARAAERRAAGRAGAVPPKLSRFAVRSATRSIRYDTSKAQQLLGWKTEVTADRSLRGAPAATAVLER